MKLSVTLLALWALCLAPVAGAPAFDIALMPEALEIELAGQAEGLSRDLGYRKGVADSQCNQAYHHFQAGRHQEALEVSGKISMATPSKRPSFLEPPT